MELEQSIVRGPAQDAGVGVVRRARPGLPDPIVRLLPVAAHVLTEGAEGPLGFAVERAARAHVVRDGVDDFPVDIELTPARGRVADPNGPGSVIAGEFLQDAFVGRRIPLHVIQDAQLRLCQARSVQEPVHERPRFVRAAEREERRTVKAASRSQQKR